MTALWEASPNFVPKALGWGTYAVAGTQTYFLISQFIDMSNKLPEPVQFCAKLVDLHRNSSSPNGKFGFHISTCHGRFKQVTDWQDTWTAFFARLLQSALDVDKQRNKEWPEFDTIAERTVTQVVPLLIGALEADGRKVKPYLIHGYLWEGNVGTDMITGEIYIFDAGAYYAHNEMEIGMWRCARHNIRSKTYKEEYLQNIGISEPVEEFQDRNRLYCVKMNVIHSAHHFSSIRVTRQTPDMIARVQKIHFHPAYSVSTPPRTGHRLGATFGLERVRIAMISSLSVDLPQQHGTNGRSSFGWSSYV